MPFLVRLHASRLYLRLRSLKVVELTLLISGQPQLFRLPNLGYEIAIFIVFAIALLLYRIVF